MSVPKNTSSTQETQTSKSSKKFEKRVAAGNAGGSAKLMAPRRTRVAKMKPSNPTPNGQPINQACLAKLKYKESSHKKYVVKRKTNPRHKKKTTFNWPIQVYGGFTSYTHSTHSHDTNSHRVIHGGNQAQMVNFGDHASTSSTSTHYAADGMGPNVDDDDGDHHMSEAGDDEGM